VRVALALRVPVDDAVFIFGAADQTLQRMENAFAEARQLAQGVYHERMREALGLAADATDAEVVAALDGQDGEQRAAAEAAVMDGISAEEIPPDIVAIGASFFCEAVKAWEGVEDEMGRPLPCTYQTREEFPTELKMRVVQEYITTRAGIVSDRGNTSGPPSNSSRLAEEPLETATAPNN